MRAILPLTIAAIAIAGGCTISNNADTANTESMKIDRYDLEVSAYPALDSASRADFLMAYADVIQAGTTTVCRISSRGK